MRLAGRVPMLCLALATLACQTEPERAPLEVPAPAWASLGCCGAYGPYSAASGASSFSCARLTTDGPPAFAHDGLLDGASAKRLKTALVEATVLGDTRHGHTLPGALTGQQGLLLGQLENRNPVRPLTQSSLLLQYDVPGGRGALQDLTGQRLRVEVRRRAISGKTTTPSAVILRTLDGQLLTASLHAMFTEYMAEALPEIRLRQVNTRPTVLERPCQTVLGTGVERYRTADVEVITLNETRTLGACQAIRIAVGCVEYVVTTGKLEDRISDDECELETPEIDLSITRRALLEPTSDPF